MFELLVLVLFGWIFFGSIYDDGVTVRIRFIDLFDIQSSLDVLCTDLNSHPET